MFAPLYEANLVIFTSIYLLGSDIGDCRRLFWDARLTTRDREREDDTEDESDKLLVHH